MFANPEFARRIHAVSLIEFPYVEISEGRKINEACKRVAYELVNYAVGRIITWHIKTSNALFALLRDHPLIVPDEWTYSFIETTGVLRGRIDTETLGLLRDACEKVFLDLKGYCGCHARRDELLAVYKSGCEYQKGPFKEVFLPGFKLPGEAEKKAAAAAQKAIKAVAEPQVLPLIQNSEWGPLFRKR